MKRRLPLAIFAATGCLAGPAWGDAMSRAPTSQSDVRVKRAEWTVSGDAYVAVNPTWWNVAASASLGFGPSVGDDRRFSVTIDVEANSSYTTPALALEWKVAAPLTLLLEYRGFAFYGADGALLNFGNASAPYGDDAIDELIGTPAETAGYGQRMALGQKFRTDVGPVIFAAQGALAVYNLSPNPGVYLDWETDKLVREVDGVFLLRAAALVAPYRSRGLELVVGPYWEGNAAGRTHLGRQRIGGLVGLRILDTVRFGVAAGVNAADPNRQGQGYAIIDLGIDLPEL